MKRYDPLKVPTPDEWLDIDEAERLSLVEGYHRRTRVQLPNAVVHATLHVVVENQAAFGDEISVQRTLDRLMKGRHRPARGDSCRCVGASCAYV